MIDGIPDFSHDSCMDAGAGWPWSSRRVQSRALATLLCCLNWKLSVLRVLFWVGHVLFWLLIECYQVKITLQCMGAVSRYRQQDWCTCVSSVCEHGNCPFKVDSDSCSCIEAVEASPDQIDLSCIQDTSFDLLRDGTLFVIAGNNAISSDRIFQD